MSQQALSQVRPKPTFEHEDEHEHSLPRRRLCEGGSTIWLRRSYDNRGMTKIRTKGHQSIASSQTPFAELFTSKNLPLARFVFIGL
jgi:hypothetical protein